MNVPLNHADNDVPAVHCAINGCPYPAALKPWQWSENVYISLCIDHARAMAVEKASWPPEGWDYGDGKS